MRKIQFLRVLTQIHQQRQVGISLLLQRLIDLIQIGRAAPENNDCLPILCDDRTGRSRSAHQLHPHHIPLQTHPCKDCGCGQQRESRHQRFAQRRIFDKPMPEQRIRRQQCQHDKRISSGQIQMGKGQRGAPVNQLHHPSQPHAQKKAGRVGGKGNRREQKNHEAQHEHTWEHPYHQKIAQNPRAAHRHLIGDQYRQRGQCGQHRDAQCIRQLFRQFLIPWSVPCFGRTSESDLDAQNGAEGQLKAHITGRIGVDDAEKECRRTGSGERVIRLEQEIARQREQKHHTCTAHRYPAAGEQHISHQHNRLRKNGRAVKAAAFVGEQTAEQADVQARNRQQMRHTCPAERVGVPVIQRRAVSQHHGSRHAAQPFGQPEPQPL